MQERLEDLDTSPSTTTGSCSGEPDAGEKVFLSTRDPRLGDEATIPERICCVVQVVDDVIQHLYWEAGVRHRDTKGYWIH